MLLKTKGNIKPAVYSFYRSALLVAVFKTIA